MVYQAPIDIVEFIKYDLETLYVFDGDYFIECAHVFSVECVTTILSYLVEENK